MTVFAGLGSPAGVLTETARAIRAAIPDDSEVLLVGIRPYRESTFAADLTIPEEKYLQLGWNAFMSLVSARTVREYEARVLKPVRPKRHEGLGQSTSDPPLTSSENSGCSGMDRSAQLGSWKSHRTSHVVTMGQRRTLRRLSWH